MQVKELTVQDFADLFGAEVSDLPKQCIDLINVGDWRYWELEGKEKDETVLDFMKRIDNQDFSIVNPGDKSRWIKGWEENLSLFKATNGEASVLDPKYMRPDMPMRLNQKFIRSFEPNFELQWYRVFQNWIFPKYVESFDTIIEFGCGSGLNIAYLAERAPKKKIIGTDWVKPSYDIVEEMRKIHGWNTEGRQFDFFSPDINWDMPENSVVLTVGALEQTGTNNDKFIDFLLEKKPALCVFIEPVYDWYDPNCLIDYLAIRAHETRNFWRGFHERLNDLERKGRAEIIKKKRSYFGSLQLEGYSQTIWRPL